jgi:hypothetical protein
MERTDELSPAIPADRRTTYLDFAERTLLDPDASEAALIRLADSTLVAIALNLDDRHSPEACAPALAILRQEPRSSRLLNELKVEAMLEESGEAEVTPSGVVAAIQAYSK